jgi:hypothetical protein
MKRDLDLCLEILRNVEAASFDPRYASAIAKELGRDELAVCYNSILLLESGFLAGEESSTLDSNDAFIIRLTWEGHELVDAARDRTHWERAKDVAHKSSGGFELIRSVLSSLAAEAAKAMAGL